MTGNSAEVYLGVLGYVCDWRECDREQCLGVPWCTWATCVTDASVLRCTRVYLGYVCDSNVDCEDGYDENQELCAAGALRHFQHVELENK